MAATTANLPLAGHRVLITRARGQVKPLAARLERLGAVVVTIPAIQIVPADPAPIDAAIRTLARYDWIVFTSSNGVTAFVDRLRAFGLNQPLPANIKIAAIGPTTADCLRDSGIGVDLVPERFVGESLVAALSSRGVDRQQILLLQAEISRDTVAIGLRRAGADVDVVVTYRTTRPEGYNADQARQLMAGVDIALFASPSAVRNSVWLAGSQLLDVDVVCIGPVTADAAHEAGLSVAAVATEHTMDGLIAAVVRLVADDEKGILDD